MASASAKRAKFRGRRTGHTFLAIPHFILKSPEFAALTGLQLKLLIEIASNYSGKNNGDLSAAWTPEIKARGWHKGTLLRVREQLVERGWLVLTRQGWNRKCSLYAITWWAVDECQGKIECPAEIVPSHAWRGEKRGLTVRPKAKVTVSEQDRNSGAKEPFGPTTRPKRAESANSEVSP